MGRCVDDGSCRCGRGGGRSKAKEATQTHPPWLVGVGRIFGDIVTLPGSPLFHGIEEGFDGVLVQAGIALDGHVGTVRIGIPFHQR